MNEQKKRNAKRIMLPIFLLAALLCFFYVWNMKANSIIVEGNEIYTDEEVAALIYEEEADTQMLRILWRIWSGYQKELPFILKYDVEAVGLRTVKVTVYEKQIIGCFVYMSNYMYFDHDGIIVESSGSRMDGVPLIEGFSFDHVTLYEALPVANEEIFTEILNLVQLLQKNDLEVARISYDERMRVTLYLAEPETVRVYLGSSEYLADKLSLLKDIEPELDGLSGILYLDTYGQNGSRETYTFKQE